MSKKKDKSTNGSEQGSEKSKAGRPSTVGDGPHLSFRVSQELSDALEAWLNSRKPPAQNSQALRWMLENFLESEGFWPPPEEEEG